MDFVNSSTFWAALVIGLIIIWALCFKKSRFWKMVEKIPGPPGVFLLGNVLDLAVDHSEHINIMKQWFEKYRKHKVFKYVIGRNVYIVLSTASSVEPILGSTSYIEKPLDYVWLEPWLGNGLLISNGEKWKKRRGLLTPAFHFRILDDFALIINEHSKVLVNRLSANLENKVFDIFPYITRCTLDIICETAMGCHVNAQVDTDSDYVKAVYKISNIVYARMLKPWLQNEWLFRLSSSYQDHSRCLKILHGFTKKVIEERKQEYKQKAKPEENQEDVLLGRRKRLAFLDLLLETSQDGKILSDQDVREEVDTFMFEGHDTTASAISSTLYLLSQNIEHQLKVQEELDDVLGAHEDQPITLEDLNNLKYLQCVVKESLRLLPPVPIFTRKLTKDVTIENYHIPAGVILQVTPIMNHLDPQVFPDPERFVPDRFAIENTVNRNPYAYIPFSAGPRNCIGQRFAMMETKILLAHILKKFRITSTKPLTDLKFLPDVILRPVHGFDVMLASRI